MTFDPISKRIILNTTNVSAVELYSRSCDWLLEGDNAKYGQVFRALGMDELGGGLIVPAYLFLQGDWRIRPMEANQFLTITGNLFVDGGGNPLVNTLGNFNVVAQFTVPVQAQGFNTAGGTSGATPQDIWEYGNRSLTTSTGGGGLNESELHLALDSYTNKDAWKATTTTVNLQPILDAIAALNDVSLLEVSGEVASARVILENIIKAEAVKTRNTILVS